MKRRGRRLSVIADRDYDLDDFERVLVVGAGKAGAAMSRTVESILGPKLLREKRVEGIVNVPHDAVTDLEAIRLHAARFDHANEPTNAGVIGARAIGDLVDGAGRRDLMLVLVSGGGSALLPAPPKDIDLAAKLETTRLLAAAGASIEELNTVRKHVSTLKGGQLAKRFRGRALVSLVISDVIGNPLDAIASGPTVPDPTTFDDALEVMRRYRLMKRVPGSVTRRLRAGSSGKIDETPKRLRSAISTCVVGDNRLALDVAAKHARRLGYRVLDLGAYIAGDTMATAEVTAGIVRSIRNDARPIAPPVAILIGGETTVTLGPDPGRGGRNQEFVLALLHHLGERDLRDVTVLSGGTDGEDGPTDAAGAVGDLRLMRAARRRRLDPRAFLARHDAYTFFDDLGGLIKTGWTETNVMDLRVILVDRRTEGIIVENAS